MPARIFNIAPLNRYYSDFWFEKTFKAMSNDDERINVKVMTVKTFLSV